MCERKIFFTKHFTCNNKIKSLKFQNLFILCCKHKHSFGIINKTNKQKAVSRKRFSYKTENLLLSRVFSMSSYQNSIKYVKEIKNKAIKKRKKQR